MGLTYNSPKGSQCGICSATEVAFHTVKEGQIVETGKCFETKTIYTQHYSKIRVLLRNRKGSATEVKFSIVLEEGHHDVGHLNIEPIVLAPGHVYNKVFDIPGTAIKIVARAKDGGCPDSCKLNVIDVVVWGHKCC